MAEIRRLTQSELAEAGRLSDTVFRDEEQRPMADAFPAIFADQGTSMSLGAFEDGRLVAFMGLVPWELQAEEASLHVFSLGSVFTVPEARGKGYASEILDAACAFARQAGASLLLVSGNRSLYQRAGCVPYGRFNHFTVGPETADKLIGQSLGSIAVREMRPEDLFAMHDAAAARPVRYRLGIHELAVQIKAESLASCRKQTHRVLVAEKDGGVIAFAVFAVSAKPQSGGMIMEYAGDPEAVARLAGEGLRQLGLTGVDVLVSAHEAELTERLAAAPSVQESDSGTLCVLNGEALIGQLQPWLAKRGAAAGELSLRRTADGDWLLGRGESQAMKLTDEQLVRLIFDRAAADGDLPPDGIVFRDLFPVPLPLSTGLCYI